MCHAVSLKSLDWGSVCNSVKFLFLKIFQLQSTNLLIVFSLRRTWEKVAKTTRQMMDRLQTLVSSDGRFKNLREALHR